MRIAKSIHIYDITSVIAVGEKTEQIVGLCNNLIVCYAERCYELGVDCHNAVVVSSDKSYILKRDGSKFSVRLFDEKARNKEEESDLSETRS